ncbi:MAG: sugar phosphate isomerase/epimerase family protein [Chloroflexota bacterium]
MQLGCNTVLFGLADRGAALQHIAWAGYSGAELAALPGMADHVDPDRDAEQARDIMIHADGLGIDLVALEAGGNTERQQRCFDLARGLGIPTVCIGSGGKPDDPSSWREAVLRLRSMAKAAEVAGITLAVKPHVGAAIYSTETALRAIREIDSPDFGINWDPSHLFRNNEDLLTSAQRLAPYIRHVHIRDCGSREQRVGPPESQIPGRGSIDLPPILRALHEGGYDGYLNLEVIGAKNYDLSRAMGIAAESRGYLNRCLQALEGAENAG